MKKIIKVSVLSLMIISLVGGTISIASADTLTPKKNQYKLVWSDEFNGDALDTDTWSYDIGTGNNGWGNSELEYYTDREDNIRVADGKLTITGKAEKYNTSDYTSARIKTKDKKYFQYGRCEARMRVPNQIGTWPAFWMLGQTNLRWPFCGELDILETWNTSNFAQGTIHYEDEIWGAGYDTYRWFKTQMNSSKTDWHLYTMTWTPKKISFSLDNVEYGDIEIDAKEMSELRAPFYFILNLALGGNLPHYGPEDSFVSADVDVDYVRVYQRDADGHKYTGVWKDKGTVPANTITFKQGSKVISRQTLTQGETAVLPKAKKKNYKLKGWYIGNSKVTENTRIYKDVVATPKFTKIKCNRPKIKRVKIRLKKYLDIKFKYKGKKDGFQIKAGKKKVFTKAKHEIVKGVRKGAKVKVRAYQIDSRGKKCYGKWSKAKRAK